MTKEDSRKKKRDKQMDESHTEGQLGVLDEQREQNNEDYKARALQFARIVFARMVGFTPNDHNVSTTWYQERPQLSFDQLRPYVHPWRTPEELPGYEEALDSVNNGNAYWIFDVPYFHEPLDIKEQIRGQRNPYRIIVQVIWDHENQVYKATGRYWYTWGHYGDGPRGVGTPQFDTGIILGISLNPRHGDEQDSTRNDMEEMVNHENWVDGEFYDSGVDVECVLDHDHGILGKYNSEFLSH